MLRPLWKKCLLVAALAVAGLTLSASPVQAGWWHWRAGCCGWYGYGCSPAYVYTTSYCSPCVTSCAWYNCNPCWYPCYSSCWAPCYSPCWEIASDCCEGVVVEEQGGVEPQKAPAPPPAAEEPAKEQAREPAKEPAPVLPPPPEPKAVPAAPDVNLPKLPETPLPPAPGEAPKPTARRSLPRDAGMLSVVVPQDARVYVNGMLTKTPGTQRQFVSYGLLPGYRYTYEVRAVVTRDGEELSDTQRVSVRVGETRDLAFDFSTRVDTVVAARLP